MATRLTMSFKNSSDRMSSYTLDDPRADLTDAEVEAIMLDMIAKNVFNTTGGDLVSISSAKVTTTSISELI
ncbi:MAG: DUF2922 domain-containing protein [Tissierellales bacterium]|nr:DUF2922 domain-containing protein [Tissierellales bacterium]MBN2827275.1 DUF2922 domain-containing protein [Tissierellales bacterium]